MRVVPGLRHFLLPMAASLGLLAAGCGSGDDNAPGSATSGDDAAAKTQPAEVSVALFPPEAEQWAVYIADAKGMFAENDLKVDAAVVQDTTKLAQALLSGSVDIAMLTPDNVIRTAQQGNKDVRLIGALVNTPSVPLVTAKDIDSVAGLRGKTIGVSSLTASDTLFVKRILRDAGLGEKDYDLVQVGGSPDRLAALTRGAIQATILSHPYDFTAQQKGFHLVASNTDAIPNYVWVAIATTQTFIQENPDALRSFMTAIQAATDWFYDPANEADAQQVLQDEVNVEKPIAELAYKFFVDNEVLAKGAKLDLEGFSNVADFVTSEEGGASGDDAAPPPVDDLVNTDFSG